MPDSFPVTVDTPLGPDKLSFVSMSGSEALGEPFEFVVDLSSEDANVDLSQLLGQGIAVHMDLTKGLRHFHGYVTSVDFVDRDAPGASYRVVLRPWLSLLANTTNCRIFQNKSVPEIIKQVFGDCDLARFEDSLTAEYPKYDYVVQYRETDFNFVSRLMERDGIYYYFQHAESSHTLVLADSLSAHQPLASCPELVYAPPDQHRDAHIQYVDRWQATQRVTSGAVTLRDFDFERTRANLTTAVSAPKDHAAADSELYDYPGGFRIRSDGEIQARVRLEQTQEQFQRGAGHTNARGLAVGGLTKLVNHPRDDQNRQYLVTGAGISIVGHDPLSGGGVPETFSCEFGAIPSAVPFRTLPKARRPRVEGPQTAIVVGPTNQEIWTDKYGRVKVQFHWDREGKNDESSSCWVRVSQAWAGTNWGAIHIPRIGQEVIVDFLEGDPDRPIITGRVYNDANMPPYDLPKNPTQSGIKSRSTKGGVVENANEIRFEDLKGEEELFVQAEKNQTTVVKANQSISVGADRTLSVTGKSTSTVGKKDSVTLKDEHEITVFKKVTETYQDDQNIDVEKNKTEHVAQTYDLKTDQEFKLTQGGTTLTFQSNQVSLDAASSITVTRGPAKMTIDDSGQVSVSTPTGVSFECGPNKITMSPSGIEISGPQVAVKAGPSSLELGPASGKLSAPMTTIEATTICSIKGTVMVNLNSG